MEVCQACGGGCGCEGYDRGVEKLDYINTKVYLMIVVLQCPLHLQEL